MSLAVVGETSLIKCTAGAMPTPLMVLPDRTVIAEFMLMGNITDMIPVVNIVPFGTCTILAAVGDPACTPIPVTPWISPAVTVLVQGMPALDKSSVLQCLVGGTITVVEPGNVTVMVP
jgi:hypothetical protein